MTGPPTRPPERAVGHGGRGDFGLSGPAENCELQMMRIWMTVREFPNRHGQAKGVASAAGHRQGETDAGMTLAELERQAS
jgi:hypothetical protein